MLQLSYLHVIALAADNPLVQLNLNSTFVWQRIERTYQKLTDSDNYMALISKVQLRQR